MTKPTIEIRTEADSVAFDQAALQVLAEELHAIMSQLDGVGELIRGISQRRWGDAIFQDETERDQCQASRLTATKAELLPDLIRDLIVGLEQEVEYHRWKQGELMAAGKRQGEGPPGTYPFSMQ